MHIYTSSSRLSLPNGGLPRHHSPGRCRARTQPPPGWRVERSAVPRLLLLGLLEALVFFTVVSPASADHRSRWHWESGTTRVIDSTNYGWGRHVKRAIALWNRVDNLRVVLAYIDRRSGDSCPYKRGYVRFCSVGMSNKGGTVRYGRWGSGYTLLEAVALVNQRNRYRSGFYKDYITCHELGHTLVLNHYHDRYSHPDSCMSYAKKSSTPSGHDYRDAALIYQYRRSAAPGHRSCFLFTCR